MGEERRVYRVLVKRPEGMRLTGRSKHRVGLRGNMKVDLKEVGWECVDWIYVALL